MKIIIKWIKDIYGNEMEVMNRLWKARLINIIANKHYTLVKGSKFIVNSKSPLKLKGANGVD